MITPPPTVLVDARNLQTQLPRIMRAVNAATFTGLDCETEDRNRHQGLNVLGKYNDEGVKSKSTKLLFDMKRTNVCGFSVYPEGHDEAYYINLRHADEENRVPWGAARFILEAKKPGAHWIAHNSPFELTVFRNALGYNLSNVICTLQMAVSTYGPDEYNKKAWGNARLGEMKKWVPLLEREGLAYEGGEFTGRLADIVVKIIAKESRAAHSYNGFCKELTYGYGLKRAIKSFFNYEMATFEETLGDKLDMGALTGDEVAKYGAEDAFWAVQLFRYLLSQMPNHAPNVVKTFFQQENPMAEVYADVWSEGMRIDLEAVNFRQLEERKKFAALLREMKAAIREIGGFLDNPDVRLVKREDWYARNSSKYRNSFVEWANSPDEKDDYLQCQQVRSAVGNAWAKDRGEVESKALNIGHYMPMRVLMYDLIQAPLVMAKGKLQSNGEARGKTKEKLEKKLADLEGREVVEGDVKLLADAEAGDESSTPVSDEDLQVVDDVEIEESRLRAGLKILDLMTKMAGVEQRAKLFITPYLHLTDPETSRVYPVVSSQLATRRMAASSPNFMQLAKRGESTYVRDFYLPDQADHVLIGIDWSAIELVIIGELSGDEQFQKAFGQIPHEDLHAGTAAQVLAVETPDLTLEDFNRLKAIKSWDEWEPDPQRLERLKKLQFDLKGQVMEPGKAFKYWRTEVGKTSNFNFWFSGFLGTTGDRMGWSPQKTADATRLFQERFATAEHWRRSVIAHGAKHGWVELPDGHRRYRWEATDQWFERFTDKWPMECYGAKLIVNRIANKIQRRAHNQLVNAIVQGSCATIAKQSILNIRSRLRELGWKKTDARFLAVIHDELVFSAHYKRAAEFVKLARDLMLDHPELFKIMKLDASPSMGLTLEPWSKTAPVGQVELFEAPPIPPVPAHKIGGRLDHDEIQAVANWLHEEGRQRLKRAA